MKDFLNKKSPVLGDYEIFTQNVLRNLTGINGPVPNVRVFLYTDGLQFVNGKEDKLINPFSNPKDFPGDFPQDIDILMGAFFGSEISEDENKGMNELKEVLGVCPEDDEKQFFLVNSPESLITLKNLFHMASGASGFCPKCIEKKIGNVNKDRIK